METKQNSFSVIIPTCGRWLVKRTIESVQRQIYDGDFEIIVVNDSRAGSDREEFSKMLDDIAEKDNRVKIIHHESEKQRVVSRNDGMKKATKDFICWLDDDDEYLRSYLYSFNHAINQYPEYSIFYCGAVVCRAERYWTREAPNLKEEGKGMEKFWSGTIGSGSFIFKRKLLDEVGYLPEGERTTPYAFSDALKKEMPEIMERFGPLYLDGGKECGNPWGEDWAMLYILTRKHKAKGLPILPYVQFVRRGKFLYQDENLKI